MIFSAKVEKEPPRTSAAAKEIGGLDARDGPSESTTAAVESATAAGGGDGSLVAVAAGAAEEIQVGKGVAFVERGVLDWGVVCDGAEEGGDEEELHFGWGVLVVV